MNDFELMNQPKRADKLTFFAFFKKAFKILNPGRELVLNWHIEYLCKILDGFIKDKIPENSLIINIPPRYLKSSLISVAWSAYLLGKNPKRRIMVASYSSGLSIKHSLDCRAIMQSLWYRNLFPNCIIRKDENRKSKFVTTEQGFRMATSIGGTMIGEGGDILIVDDPLTPTQAHSKTYRNKAVSWYRESFATRLNDKKNGKKIIIMQRLHEEDLSGVIEKESPEGWKIIKIPAMADKDLRYEVGSSIYLFKKDEVLDKNREPKEELYKLKNQMGTQAFVAQYLQTPTSDEGSIIKRKWLNQYNTLPQKDYYVVQSWDLAFTSKTHNDYSVCSTWYVCEGNYYLADIYRVQKEFPILLKEAIELYDKWQADYAIIEDTVASKAFIQEMRMQKQQRIVAVVPNGDKITRLAICSPIIEAGKIFLPNDADWLFDFENELLKFPEVKNDDQVDTVSQFLNFINKILPKDNNNCIRQI